MKLKRALLLLAGNLLLITAIAQVNTVQVQEGPILRNDVDNKLNRMIDGEEGYFYGYRIRSKGKGTSFFIEKYDKENMKLVFSKPLNLPTEKTKVQEVIFAGNKVYVIYRTYDKEQELMTLFYTTISRDGTVSQPASEIMARKTDHYEFIDFEIAHDNQRSNIAVKCTHKPNKTTEYATDFVLFDANTEKVKWTKTVTKYLKRTNPWMMRASKTGEGIGLLGFQLEDNGDIFYAFNEKLNKDDNKDKRYNATVEILLNDKNEPIETKLDLNPEYVIYDLHFSLNDNSELQIVGFFKDVIERKGRDLVDVGLFTYKIDTKTGKILEEATKTFDEKMLFALESDKKKSRYTNYKVDYILHHGDDFYVVGEQYRVVADQKKSGFNMNSLIALSAGAHPFDVGFNFHYEYMDIIVAKINSHGEFEWVTNSPLRNGTTTSDIRHVFKQYIAHANESGLYLFYNEHQKNAERLKQDDYEPKDLKTQFTIHGSNFVYSKVTYDGKQEHEIAFENEDFCFAPIQERNIQFLPPEEAEIFVKGNHDEEIIIYLDDRGKGKFAKVTLN